MKKLIVAIVVLFAFGASGMGQSSLGKTDDLGRVAISAIVPDEAGVPGGAQQILQNKMMQIATNNGLGAVVGSQFAMVPMITIISKEVTPTAPPMVAMNLEMSFYIVDIYSQTIFNQTSIVLKGVGKTEDAAYAQALKGVNPRTGQFRGFIEKGKEKIIECYNSQCDVIISRAKALAGQKNYEEALYILMSVPDISRECFDKCMSVSMDVYKEYSNQLCNNSLSAAKAAWAGKDLSTVEENLGKITPDMECYPQAEQLIAQITAAVEQEGASSWTFKMKRYDDSVDIQKMKIQAGRDVAMNWSYSGSAKEFDWKWLYKN